MKADFIKSIAKRNEFAIDYDMALSVAQTIIGAAAAGGFVYALVPVLLAHIDKLARNLRTNGFSVENIDNTYLKVTW